MTKAICSPTLKAFMLSLGLFFTLSGNVHYEDIRYAEPSHLYCAPSGEDTEKQALVQHLAGKYKAPQESVTRIVNAAYDEGAKTAVSPLLILAVIEKESSLNIDASNTYGAKGLMQVVPRFHPDKMKGVSARSGLFHPETNIRVGAQILREYLAAKRGNVEGALVKYSGNALHYAQRVLMYKAKLNEVVLVARLGTKQNDSAV
jgi:soluble lytic murein transglycosylase-like protein